MSEVIYRGGIIAREKRLLAPMCAMSSKDVDCTLFRQWCGKNAIIWCAYGDGVYRYRDALPKRGPFVRIRRLEVRLLLPCRAVSNEDVVCPAVYRRVVGLISIYTSSCAVVIG